MINIIILKECEQMPQLGKFAKSIQFSYQSG